MKRSSNDGPSRGSGRTPLSRSVRFGALTLACGLSVLTVGCGDGTDDASGPATPATSSTATATPGEAVTAAENGKPVKGGFLGNPASTYELIEKGGDAFSDEGRGLLIQFKKRDEDPKLAGDLVQTLQEAGAALMSNNRELGYSAFYHAGAAAESAANDLDAAGLTEGQVSQALYNMACAAALFGKPEEAEEKLKKAIELGFEDTNLLKNDPDLASLRERDGFDEMMASLYEVELAKAKAEAEETLADAETYPLEFTYTDIEGNEHTLADYKGKVVIVDFWGTWCPPCRAEIPSFVELQTQHGDAGLQILGLNYRDKEPEIKSFVAEYGINYPTGLGSDETREMVPDFRGYPTTVFVGRDGTVRATVVGAHPKAFLEAMAMRLLEEETPAEEQAAMDSPAVDSPADRVAGDASRTGVHAS